MPILQIKPGTGVEVIGGQFIQDRQAEFINPTPETEQVATNIHNSQWPHLSHKTERGEIYANLHTKTPITPVVIDKVLKNGTRAEIHRQDYRKITELNFGDDETLTIRGEIIDYSFTNDEDYIFYTKEGEIRGDERQELYCVNTRTGNEVWKEGNVGDVIIAGENCVYQLRADETSLYRTIWRRGTRRNGKEELVYRELIPTNSLTISPSSDRRHVIISRMAWLNAEFLKVRLTMNGRVEKICRGVRGVKVDSYKELTIIQRGEALYILDGLRSDATINEEPVLRERPGIQLLDWVCYKNSIIVAETNLGQLQLKIIQFSPARRRWRVQELTGTTLETLGHGDIYGGAEIETGVGIGGGESDEVLVYVKGVLTPSMTLGVRIPDQGEFRGDEVRIVSMSVCNRFNRDSYETAKYEGVSPDGTKIPYVVFRNRTAPECRGAYLLVYGSYGSIGQFDDFSLDLVSLMDSGVWVVIGMIRGGGEFGKEWHLSGAGLNKMNSVYDCRTIVEDLHRTRNVPGIIVKGRSAGAYVAGRLLSLGVEIGGLRGVVIQVGFVDNLMSMLDQSAPLTLGELREFGNPLMRRADMEFLNENGVIPSLLKCGDACREATTGVGVYIEYGLNDTRVRYTEGLRLYLILKEKRIGRDLVGLFFPNRGHLRGEHQNDEEALIDSVRVEWILKNLGNHN